MDIHDMLKQPFPNPGGTVSNYRNLPIEKNQSLEVLVAVIRQVDAYRQLLRNKDFSGKDDLIEYLDSCFIADANRVAMALNKLQIEEQVGRYAEQLVDRNSLRPVEVRERISGILGALGLHDNA